MKTNCSSEVVRKRLCRVTPGQILGLLFVYEVNTVFLILPEGIQGNLSGFGKWWTFVISKSQARAQQMITLLHEAFHLILINEGLDDVYEAQLYDDKILDWAAGVFITKYPSFPEIFCAYLDYRHSQRKLRLKFPIS